MRRGKFEAWANALEEIKANGILLVTIIGMSAFKGMVKEEAAFSIKEEAEAWKKQKFAEIFIGA